MVLWKQRGDYMIRIAIIDDAVEIGTQLETILIEITTNKGIAIDTDIYYSGKELCEHLQNGEFYDLIFLDIEMPEFTGIDVSKMIRDNLKNDATQIAYISGNKEYAIEIFEYDPLYFVHKPINKEKIEKVFERLIHRLHLQADAFTYKTGHNIVKIPIKDIIYFESEDHQIIIHYYTQNEYHKDSFYGLLDHVQKQLDSFQFLRIHKTYLVHHLYVPMIRYIYLQELNCQSHSQNEKRSEPNNLPSIERSPYEFIQLRYCIRLFRIIFYLYYLLLFPITFWSTDTK